MIFSASANTSFSQGSIAELPVSVNINIFDLPPMRGLQDSVILQWFMNLEFLEHWVGINAQDKWVHEVEKEDFLIWAMKLIN